MDQTILTFYKFISFPEFKDWKPKLLEQGKRLSILGTIILAKEGINATISGTDNEINEFLNFIRSNQLFFPTCTEENQKAPEKLFIV